MTVQEIVEKWLADNGYGGLVNDSGCGCNLDDFMPCGGDSVTACEAAYKYKCKKDPDRACMSRKKDAEPNCDNCEEI